jgi:hypothetical protein
MSTGREPRIAVHRHDVRVPRGDEKLLATTAARTHIRALPGRGASAAFAAGAFERSVAKPE